MSRPSSWLALRLFRCSIAEPTRSFPNSLASRRGRPSEHTCSRWRLKPVSTHSSTSTKPRSGGISARLKTGPPYSTGASQNPHPVSQDRYPGFPACRRPFKIITCGVDIWLRGPSSFPASRIRSETVPAIAANSRYGHRPAATRQPPLLVNLPSGEPRTVSTRKTADQPEQDTCKRRPPFGNRTSTEPLPYAAAALAQT